MVRGGGQEPPLSSQPRRDGGVGGLPRDHQKI